MVKFKPVQILSIDAKDLYGANIVGKEYTAKYADGRPNFKKYINTFDDSLDLRKLREVYFKVYRRNDFGFFNKNIKQGGIRREYTNQVINVTFNYSYKAYNKCSKNIYVKDGYSIKDLQIDDCICIVGGGVAAIEVGRPVAVNCLDGLDNRYFRFNEELGVYEQTRSIKTLMSVKSLRKYLYENGFILDGVKYVRYKRSSGSARVGKCLFINEDLYSRMHKWDMCGLKIRGGQDIDLAAFEAAISLALSSIIDTVEILPENILLIEDYDSVFEDEIIGVSLEDGCLCAKPERRKISNSIWDGQSLLDKSVFGDKYAKCGMLLLRNRFFKTCGFNTDIQKWFADNEITSVSQLNGVTLATDVSQIKMITTPNSIKYLKFGSLTRWLHNIDKEFGVVKYDKPTHFFDGRMVQTHYQLINTLQLSYNDIESFLQPSLDYITKIKTDPAVLRYHIKYPYLDPEDLEYRSKNDVVFGLMGLNEDFTRTRLYQSFKKDLVKSLVKNLRKGHVLVNGTYATMFGNGLEMLKSAIGRFTGESDIGIGNVYSKRFPDKTTILGTRSPHINSGNVYLATNVHLSEFDKYFQLTNEIICVNAIDENIQQRLNGCDYDSDALLITDHPLLIERAKANYNNFLVPTSFVEAEKTQRQYTTAHQADLDVKTSVNKIGEIVNLSQELNSLLWHNMSKKVVKHNIEDSMELYYDICKLAVLSGIEIDRAKKEFLVDSRVEIELLKSKYKIYDSNGRVVKPKFFRMITLENGYVINPKTNYCYTETPMDYLQRIIWRYCYSSHHSNFNSKALLKASDYVPLHTIIHTIDNIPVYGSHRNRAEPIISELRRYAHDLRMLYMNKPYPLDCKDRAVQIKNMRTEYLMNLKIGKMTAYLLLRCMEDDSFRDISVALFELLFCFNKSLFEVFEENRSRMEVLKECKCGEIRLYDFLYTKI